MKYKVLITRDIPDEGIKMLKADKRIDLEIFPGDEKIPRRKLLKMVKGKDIILSILTEKMDKAVFDAAGPQLKMIANYAVGFDNIDLQEAAKRKIKVTNAPHPNVSESVAEHGIALIFALAHRIVESDDYTRALKYKAWGPKLLLGTDVMGKTVGIVGAGAIGMGIIQRLHDGFGVNILYNDIKRNPQLEKKYKAKFRPLPDLLKQSDFVSLHVPLLPATRHLISTKQFRLMKKTAFLINTARGPVVDEKALIKALINGDIAGAGLDTYECEPLIDCNPRDKYELRRLPNVVLTPHTASATLETRQAMSRVAAQNILAFVKGKKPPNLVKS